MAWHHKQRLGSLSTSTAGMPIGNQSALSAGTLMTDQPYAGKAGP